MAQISNWMHVYLVSVPEEKVRAGKAANDNSNTMSVNQNGSVKDGRDDFGNKVDREELITNSNIPYASRERLWRPRTRTSFGVEENAK